MKMKNKFNFNIKFIGDRNFFKSKEINKKLKKLENLKKNQKNN